MHEFRKSVDQCSFIFQMLAYSLHKGRMGLLCTSFSFFHQKKTHSCKVHLGRFDRELGQHVCHSNCSGEHTMEGGTFSFLLIKSDVSQALLRLHCVGRVCMRSHMVFRSRDISKNPVSGPLTTSELLCLFIHFPARSSMKYSRSVS